MNNPCPHCGAESAATVFGILWACGRQEAEGRLIAGCPHADALMLKMSVRAADVLRLEHNGQPTYNPTAKANEDK